MGINGFWIWLALAAALLMAIASAAGVILPGVYAGETASWAAQGIGQDFANLFLVVPALLISLHFAHRGSTRAALVALGLLVYTVYSYVLYAFFIHFGPLFLVYVATLGVSSYAMSGCAIHLSRAGIPELLSANEKSRPASVLLLIVGALFALQWLSEIIPALLSGSVPKGVTDIGAPVNPVHVIDLAFILPGMIATAIAAWQGRRLGLLFAAPMLVFSAVMGVAILCMFVSQHARGEAISPVPVGMVSAVVFASAYYATAFLRRVS